MDLQILPAQGPVRAAASIVMLRDGDRGLEVFLMKRHGLSDVLGGVHVFPGGKVDAQDATLDLQAHLDLPPSALQAALGEAQLDPLEAAALHMAALREALEESGVLFAQAAGAREAAMACRLLREGRGWGQVLTTMSLRLETSRLQPWSRWITPVLGAVVRKRFDTRFFLAAVPAGQTPVHDGHEAIDSVWLSPRTALQWYWERRIELAPPQIMSLAHLSRHSSVAAALAEARGRLPPTVRPEPFEQEGTRIVCYPGDARHPVHERAMAGPTRLHYRDRRYEPAEGFEAFFSDRG